MAEIKLMAERKAGDMLAGMKKNKGGGDHRLRDGTGALSTYEDLGIGKNQASRWQLEVVHGDVGNTDGGCLLTLRMSSLALR